MILYYIVLQGRPQTRRSCWTRSWSSAAINVMWYVVACNIIVLYSNMIYYYVKPYYSLLLLLLLLLLLYYTIVYYEAASSTWTSGTSTAGTTGLTSSASCGRACSPGSIWINIITISSSNNNNDDNMNINRMNHKYMCVYIHIYIYIYIWINDMNNMQARDRGERMQRRLPHSAARGLLHSAKGGAVETGCSGLHYIVGCFVIWYCPHPLHPLPTAPPCNEYPVTVTLNPKP